MVNYKRLTGYDAPSGSAAELVSINDSGAAVGNYSFDLKEHGYLVKGGTAPLEPIDVPTSVSTSLVAIDDDNNVFGNYTAGTGTADDERGFARRPDGTFLELDDALPADLKGNPAAITAASRSGEVTGTFSQNGVERLFTARLTSNGFEAFNAVDLKAANGLAIQADAVSSSAVNDQGDIVGTYVVNGQRTAFVEHGGVTTKLQGPQASETDALGINNSGEVVGSFTVGQPGQTNSAVHGFTYTAASGFKQVDVAPGAGTHIEAVNDAGRLTGYYSTGQGAARHDVGFILTGQVLTTLDSGFAPVDINQAGIVAGSNVLDPDTTNPDHPGPLQGLVYGPAGNAYAISATADVFEGNPGGQGGIITFTVTRSDPSTAGSVAVLLSGTALLGQDYTVSGLGPNGVIGFGANQASSSFTVKAAPDSVVEADETVTATLTRPSNADDMLAQASATARILNDDGPTGGRSAAVPAAQQAGINLPTNNTASPSVAADPSQPIVTFDPTVAVAPSDVVTLSGTYTAVAGIGSIIVAENGAPLGTATANPDGTWSLVVDFTDRPGSHSGLAVTATDARGAKGMSQSPYDLTTDLTKAETGGEPYRTIEQRYDPTSGVPTTSVLLNRNGSVYLNSQQTADADGGTTYTYSGGSFFAGQGYTSFADHYAADGTLTQHSTFSDGVETAQVLTGDQALDAADTAAPGGTHFTFGPHLGHSTIVDFVTGGPGHDSIDLGRQGGGRPAQILAHARDDGAGDAVLAIGHGNIVTLAGVAPGELTRRDFTLHG